MFINIIREQDDGRRACGIYECDRVFLRPTTEGPNGTPPREHDVEVNMESNGPGGSITLVLDKQTTELYVMNENGRTIDSYNWPSGYRHLKRS